MLDIVYEFLGIAGLEEYPSNLQEFLPYFLQFIVALVLVLAVFKLISAIVNIFCNWRWLR